MTTPRRKTKPQPLPADWEVSETFYWNGRHITKGTELSITGARGRYRFVKHVKTPKAEWIDTVGGGTRTRSDMARSFAPNRIKTVHRIAKTRANAKEAPK